MKFRNICILRVGAIGDVLHTLPIVSLLAECFRKHKITYVTSSPLVDLLKHARGIDQVVPINFKSNPLELIDQFQTLKQASVVPEEVEEESKSVGFDIFINLQPNWKSRLLAYLLGSRQYYEYHKAKGNNGLNPSSQQEEHAWVNFAKSYFHDKDLEEVNIERFFPLIDLPETVVRQAAKELNLDPYKKHLALIPGVGLHRPHRAWPLSNWVNLINLLEERGDERLNLLLLGGPDEIELCKELEQKTQHCKKIKIYNLCGQFNLLGTAAILKNCDLVIGGDTGPIHLAAALACKCICLFGPTSPARHAPFVGIGLQAPDYQCAKACTQKKCVRPSLNCMESLTPEEVWLAMNEV